jgi:hypothetical protein
MYRPELCARPGVSAKPPLLCPSLQSPSGGWELTLQPGFPDSPRVLVGLSAGPVGHRQPGSFFPRSPAAGEGTRPPTPLSGRTAEASQPRPFRVAQRPALGPPRYGVRSSGGLSASTRLVECGASPHFLRHPASPAAQRVWGTQRCALRPRHQPGRDSPPPYRAGPPGQGPLSPKETSIRPALLLSKLATKDFTGPPTTRSQPRQWGDQTPPPPGHPPRPPPPGAPPLKR